jgi:hypothetical protein
LQFADKDVKDLAAALQQLQGKTFDEVRTTVLVNEGVTREAIAAAKSAIAAASPDDTLVVFAAGHGVHDRDAAATYYYLTHEAELANLGNTAATFEQIEALLQGVLPRNKLLLLDTCESGEADPGAEAALISAAGARGMISRGVKAKPAAGTAARAAPRDYLRDRARYIYSDVSRRTGAIVFSSSRGGELSYERADLQNGVFTRKLIDALGAGREGRSPLPVDELRRRVASEVSEATGGLQNPTVDRDNLYQRFKL